MSSSDSKQIESKGDELIATESLISRKHACELLGISDRHLRRLIAAGRLVAVGKGHSRAITRESLRKFLAERNSDISYQSVDSCPRNLLKNVPPM